MQKVSFFQKYQVVITGIAGALTLVIQQFMVQAEFDWKAFGVAAAVAVGGVVANEWRGKGVSVLGLISVVGAAVAAVGVNGSITWPQLFFAIILGALSLASPPPKSEGYEHSDIIKEAKQEGERDIPTKLAPKPDSEKDARE